MNPVRYVFGGLLLAACFGCVCAGEVAASTDGDASTGDLKIQRKLLPPDDPFWCVEERGKVKFFLPCIVYECDV